MGHIPAELLRHPEMLTMPPVKTRPNELPFGELGWENFERILYRLAKSENEVEHCMLYGRNGQEQKGIDIYSRMDTGKYHCWQAKNYSKYSAKKIKAAVDLYMTGEWAKRSSRFVLCVSAGLNDIAIQEEIERQSERLRLQEIEFIAYDGLALSDKLREHPRIIDDFFGRGWLVAFLGDAAAEGLRRPISASKICNFLTKLAAHYDSRFRILDPGLTIEPTKLSSSDVRHRFVSTDVDESNLLQSPLNTDVDYTKPSYSDRASVIEEPNFFKNMEAVIELSNERLPESLRIPTEDWLLQKNQSLLIGEAGSGKSTILRSLALDFVSTPLVFNRLVSRLSPRIPILVPFSLWARMTEKLDREVHIADVIRECYRAHFSEDEIENSFIESLLDERLLLLIDGLDEYGNEYAARLALATLDTFVSTHNVYTIATARPAGYKRLGTLSRKWQVGGIVGLSIIQQREFAKKLLRAGLADVEDTIQNSAIDQKADDIFNQIESTGNVGSLAVTPLLLQCLISVSVKNAILPSTKFELFEQMISLLLEEHPKKRATAAVETIRRNSIFEDDGLRRAVLSRLAFEIQLGAYDSGITKSKAKEIIIKFLTDPDSCVWNKDQAARAARELIEIDANTTGLIAERGPDEISFFHAAFREHLAGSEISSWELEQQIKFACENSDNPRWRGALLSLFKFLPRNTDVSKIISAIKDGCVGEANTVDRRLLLAEAAFTCSSKIGKLGIDIITEALNSVETGCDDNERFELLELALDGPRAGTAGELIASRLESWWPCSNAYMKQVYFEMGQWDADIDIERALIRGLFDDSSDNRFAASLVIGQRYSGQQTTKEALLDILNSCSSPGVVAAVLNALIIGWPDEVLNTDWIEEGVFSRNREIKAVTFLAKFDQGWRDDEALEILLEQLERFSESLLPSYLTKRLENCLVETWSECERVQNICWASLNQWGPSDYRFEHDVARHILLRIHTKDVRVAKWIADEFRRDDRGLLLFGLRDYVATLAEAINSSKDTREVVDAWFCNSGDSIRYNYNAAILASLCKSDAAKGAMLALLEDQKNRLDFWPIHSLLTGWGMDQDVSKSLKKLLDRPVEELQHIAEYLPAIIKNNDDCFQKLLEICSLENLKRPDFVIRGFAGIGRPPNDSTVVDAILHHVPGKSGIETGVRDLILHFYEDPRVRQFTLDRLSQRDGSLNVISKVYQHDTEIRNLVLKRCSPLPSALRRVIAKRASQRLEDPILNRILETCDIEIDPTAKSEATIGFAKRSLNDLSRKDTIAEMLAEQLIATGPDMLERRCAAFGGLVALDRLDLFQDKAEPYNNKLLTIDLIPQPMDVSPVVEIVANNWWKIEPFLGSEGITRFSRWSKSGAAPIWDEFTPFLSRSNRLREQFVKFCESTEARVGSKILLALARELPGSDLLRKYCYATLGPKAGERNLNPLDEAHACLIASICISEFFSSESESLSLLECAISNYGRTIALVGLAKGWPDHSLLQQHWATATDPDKNRLGWTSHMWLASLLGTGEEFMTLTGNFSMRSRRSPWDFPLETLNAVTARIEKDPSVKNNFFDALKKSDDPNVRASFSSLLHQSFISSSEIDSFLIEIYNKECMDFGCQRFGLDITTNRIRRIRDVMEEILFARS